MVNMVGGDCGTGDRAGDADVRPGEMTAEPQSEPLGVSRRELRGPRVTSLRCRAVRLPGRSEKKFIGHKALRRIVYQLRIHKLWSRLPYNRDVQRLWERGQKRVGLRWYSVSKHGKTTIHCLTIAVLSVPFYERIERLFDEALRFGGRKAEVGVASGGEAATGRPGSAGPLVGSDGPFLKVAEVARMLRTTSVKIIELIKREDLPAVSLGDSTTAYRIPRAAFDEWMRSRTTGRGPDLRNPADGNAHPFGD